MTRKSISNKPSDKHSSNKSSIQLDSDLSQPLKSLAKILALLGFKKLALLLLSLASIVAVIGLLDRLNSSINLGISWYEADKGIQQSLKNLENKPGRSEQELIDELHQQAMPHEAGGKLKQDFDKSLEAFNPLSTPNTRIINDTKETIERVIEINKGSTTADR